MKKSLINILVLAIIVIGIIYALKRASDAPVIFEDRNGNVCGCITPAYQIPCEEACKDVDRDELHEVIKVSHCN